MSKPFKRHELEQIWQVPKRRKQVELKIEHNANALTALFTDDDITQPDVVQVDAADVPLFEWFELEEELHAMANNKSCDNAGVIAEMLKYAPILAKDLLLSLLNALLVHGNLPDDWRTTHFIMIAKHLKAKAVDEFRPIALLNIGYNVYARLLNTRVRKSLDAHQPPSQAGSRKGFLSTMSW